MKWGRDVFLDTALPFGLRSAPKFFSPVPDVLLWIMAEHGLMEGIHFLDDFLFAGGQGSPACAQTLAGALEMCHILGLPVAPPEIQVPSSCIVYLGNLINTVKGEVSLPEEKLAHLLAELDTWSGKGLHQTGAFIPHLSPPLCRLSRHSGKTTPPQFNRDILRFLGR